jgi:hypothetical protein
VWGSAAAKAKRKTVPTLARSARLRSTARRGRLLDDHRRGAVLDDVSGDQGGRPKKQAEEELAQEAVALASGNPGRPEGQAYPDDRQDHYEKDRHEFNLRLRVDMGKQSIGSDAFRSDRLRHHPICMKTGRANSNVGGGLGAPRAPNRGADWSRGCVLTGTCPLDAHKISIVSRLLGKRF